MPVPLRTLLLVMLALAPTGCDWCQAPDLHTLGARGVVRDATGAELGTVDVALASFEDRQGGWLTVDMLGPEALADSGRAGWPAGGPLQGWTDRVRLVDANGATLFEARPRRGIYRATFERASADVAGDRLRALRASLRSGRRVIVLETIDDPLVPLPGPVRATLPDVRSARSAGGCT